MEGAGGDEEDVVGLHAAVLRAHRRALDDRQKIPLDALARHVGPRGARLAAGDLVDLVEEDDAALLTALDGELLHAVVVDELLRLLLLEDLERFGDQQLAALRLAL